MWNYRKRLTRDLPRWKQNGWLTADGEAKILADVAASGREVGLAAVLGILASVLFGFAVISFVAAHWQEIPRSVRLGALLALIVAGYTVGGVFASRGAQAFSDAAIMFACAVFGASIMLISQMFHIDGHPPDGVLLWCVGTVLAGVVLRSNATLAFGLVLAVVWSGMEMSGRSRIHWPFLIPWAVLAAAFVWQRWGPGLHLSALTLAGFAVVSSYVTREPQPHVWVLLTGLVAAVAALAVARTQPDWEDAAHAILAYAVATAFAGLFALQFVEDPARGTLILLAAVALVLLLAAIAYGMTYRARGVLWVAYIAFSVEVLAIYWKTIGSIISQSLFFLIAGLLVAAIAFLAWQIASRTESRRAVA